MGTILIILLLIFIGYPLFKAWLFMHRMRKQMQQAQQQMEDMFRNASQRENSNDDEEYSNTRVFSDEGEDAEFETVDTPRKEIEPKTTYPQENQITDAEFEEIK